MRRGPMLQPLLPYTPERDIYRLLGVPATATSDEIAVACRRLARAFHPDRNRSARADAEMAVVNTVRRVLTDPQMRAVYDRERMRFQAGPRWATPPRAVAWDPPPYPPPRAPKPVGRYLRAALVGLRAAVAGLLPGRCASCRTVISGADAYCAACGTPLLTGT